MSKSQQIDANLKEKFEQVGYDTIDGQTCQATVTDITEYRGEVKVSTKLPSGKVHTERFEMPEVNSDRYAFVRLLNGLGYDLITAEESVGSTVNVEFDDDGSRILVPERQRSVRERASMAVDTLPMGWWNAIMAALMLLSWPLVFPSVYPKWHNDRWSWGPDVEDWLMEGIIFGFIGSACAWALFGAVVYSILSI